MRRIAIIAAIVLALAAASAAQVPRKISYQGILKGAGGVVAPEGDYSLAFSLYVASSGGTPVWSETQVVHVTAGILDATLGAVTPLAIPFDREYWLGIAVDGGPEMSPRTLLTAAPYAICAEEVTGSANLFPSSGSVGIGTTIPGAELHVLSDVNGVASIQIQNPNTGANSVERLDFTDENGEVCGIAVFDDDHVSYPSRMNIFNNRPGGSMHLIAGGGGVSIADDGKVGVDRSAPLERLDVDGAIRLGSTSDTNAGTIRWTGTDFEGCDGSTWHSLTGGSGGELPPGAANQTLRHNGSDWVASSLLSNDGSEIGVGTTSPDYPLHVVSPEIRPVMIEGTAGGAWALVSIDGSSGSLPGIEYRRSGTVRAYEYVSAGDDYRLWVGGDVRLVVDDTEGEVGIGVAEPNAPLHLAGLNWDLDGTEGDLKIGDDTYRLKIGVATAGLGAGSAGIRVQGGLERLLLGAGSEEVVEITTGGLVKVGSDLLTGNIDLYRGGVGTPVLETGSDSNGGRIDIRDENDHAVVMVSADGSGTGGFVRVNRNDSNIGIELNGHWSMTEEPYVNIYGSARSASFRMDQAGDASVYLPASSIASDEMLDEPGVASYGLNIGLTLAGGLETVLSRTITVPATGYVMVVGTCQPRANHTTGTDSYMDLGVSDDPASLPSNQDLEFRIPSAAATGLYTIPATATAVFTVAAGAPTFYLLADENLGNFSVFDAQLTLVYLPTAYGTVVEPAVALGAVSDDAAPPAPALGAAEIERERSESIAGERERVDREIAAMRAEIEELKRLAEKERKR